MRSLWRFTFCRLLYSKTDICFRYILPWPNRAPGLHAAARGLVRHRSGVFRISRIVRLEKSAPDAHRAGQDAHGRFRRGGCVDNTNGVQGGFGDHLFSPVTMVMLLVALVGVAGTAAFSFVPLRVPMLQLLCMVGGAYIVLAVVWHHRWGVPFRPVLPYVLLGIFLLWGLGNLDAVKALYSNGEPTPTPIPTPPSAPAPTPFRTTTSIPTPTPTPTPAPTPTSKRVSAPKPVSPARPGGGVDVIVSDRKMDAALRQDVERIVKREVGTQHYLHDVFVEVDVESLFSRDERAPGKGDLSSTGAHAKVSIVAYAPNSNRILHKVNAIGRSVAFQGQESPMDQMKKEALSDALESAFKQIR